MSELGPLLPDDCAVARAELGALLDEELNPAARESVERHLAGCVACRAELSLLRAMSQAVGALPRPAPPDSLRYRLRAAVAEVTAGQRFEVLACWTTGSSRREMRRDLRAPRESAPTIGQGTSRSAASHVSQRYVHETGNRSTLQHWTRETG